jgi:hypothetical protein
MTADPTHPDTFEDDDIRDTGTGDEAEVPPEAPEADAAEQHADLTPPPREVPEEGSPDGANEADRAEQARVVELDEDDYR